MAWSSWQTYRMKRGNEGVDFLEHPLERDVCVAFLRWAELSGQVCFNEVYTSRKGRADVILMMPYFQFYLIECKAMVILRDVKRILAQLQRYSEDLGRVVGMGVAVHERSITPAAAESLGKFNIQVIRLSEKWFTSKAIPDVEAFYPIIRTNNVRCGTRPVSR